MGQTRYLTSKEKGKYVNESCTWNCDEGESAEFCCDKRWGKEGPGCCSTKCRDYVKKHDHVWYWHLQTECPRICWDGCTSSDTGTTHYNYDHAYERRRLEEAE